MSGLAFHLISAHDVVPSWRLHPAYTALCGARVATGEMPVTSCPNECECETSPGMAYCQGCLSEAIRQNGRAGVDGLAALDQDRQRAGHSHG